MSDHISAMTPSYRIGDKVYFKLDEDSPGHVTAIIIEAAGVLYRVCWCDTSVSCHYAFELTTEKTYGNN